MKHVMNGMSLSDIVYLSIGSSQPLLPTHHTAHQPTELWQYPWSPLENNIKVIFRGQFLWDDITNVIFAYVYYMAYHSQMFN